MRSVFGSRQSLVGGALLRVVELGVVLLAPL